MLAVVQDAGPSALHHLLLSEDQVSLRLSKISVGHFEARLGLSHVLLSDNDVSMCWSNHRAGCVGAALAAMSSAMESKRAGARATCHADYCRDLLFEGERRRCMDQRIRDSFEG